MKRSANRLTNEIKKKIRNQTGQGDPVFSVSDPDENYFVLDIHNSKSFHKTHPAPDKNLSDLEPHLSALFQSLIDEMRVKYGEFGLARIYIDHPNLEKAIIVTPREIDRSLASSAFYAVSGGRISSCGCLGLCTGQPQIPCCVRSTDATAKNGGIPGMILQCV